MTPVYAVEDVARSVTTVLIECQCVEQCVAGSAILLGTLHKSGFPDAFPLSLRAKLWNPQNPSQGILLGHGNDPVPGKWAGHLAVVVPDYSDDGHLLIDLTIVQLNHKVPGVSVEPFLGIVSDNFVKGLEENSTMVDDCCLAYEAFPADDSYITKTNWATIPNLDAIIELALHHLKSNPS